MLEFRFIAALLWAWSAGRRGGRAIIVIVEAPASIPHLGAALSPRRRGPDAGPAGAAAPAAGGPVLRQPERPEEREGAAGGLYRHVAVAAQLEVGRAAVIDLPESGHDGREVEVAFAGEEVLVPVAAHPLGVHLAAL